MTWDSLAREATRQHGLVTTTQILNSMSPQQFRTVRRRRLLVPAAPGKRPRVFKITGAPTNRHQALHAAVLQSGPLALASHAAANWSWDLGLPAPFELEVLVPRGHEVEHPGARVHTSLRIADADRSVRHGIPVTSVARTLIDLSARFSDVQLATAVREAQRRKLLELGDLVEARERLRHTTGWDRAQSIDRVIAAELGQPIGASEPERRVFDLIVRSGLPTPELGIQLRVEGQRFELDGGWPNFLVGWEYDGHHHLRPVAFHRDRWRLSSIQALTPWRLLYFTSKSSDSFIVSRLEAALRQAGWKPAA